MRRAGPAVGLRGSLQGWGEQARGKQCCCYSAAGWLGLSRGDDL